MTPSPSVASRYTLPAMSETPRSLRIWMDGALVGKEDAKVSVFDHAVLYGDGCFEGIRAYNGRIFKLGAHLRRMFDSARRIRLTPAYTIEEVEKAVRETVAANELTDAYIRLIFTRGAGTLGLHPFRCPTPGTIIIADSIQLYPEELYREGMKVIVAERPRIPIECLDPAIKSLNYLNNILAKIEAIDAGVLEAIMLNTDGFVAECTGDNIFIIRDGRILTPPAASGILHGITRQYVIDTLCPALGFAIEERMMRLPELLEADEVFLTGTAAEIIGVSQVGDHTIGGGRVGPMTAALTDEFRRRVAAGAPED